MEWYNDLKANVRIRSPKPQPAEKWRTMCFLKEVQVKFKKNILCFGKKIFAFNHSKYRMWRVINTTELGRIMSENPLVSMGSKNAAVDVFALGFVMSFPILKNAGKALSPPINGMWLTLTAAAANAGAEALSQVL
jgi:hypothetical protein